MRSCFCVFRVFAFLLCNGILMVHIPGCSNAPGDSLEVNFRNPPLDARPMTWWHWMNGNVTKDGITADLEAMQRIGLRGCLTFNVNLDLPKGPAVFMQPEWLALLDHTVKEAGRLGLEFGVHNCDGWSQAGGPWITPERSMKVLTWTTKTVTGPAHYDGNLEHPRTLHDFYRDIAIIAFPTPAGGSVNGRTSGVTLRGGQPHLDRLIDGNPATTAAFPVAGGAGHTLDFVFPAPVTVQSLSIGGYTPYQLSREIPALVQASDNGTDFETLCTFDMNWSFREYPARTSTVAFEPERGRIFHLQFHNDWPIELGEIMLSDAARLHYWEAQAGWARKPQHGGEIQAFRSSPGPSRGIAVDESRRITRNDIQVFRGQLQADGRFQWDVPAGSWTMMRLGYTTNGHTNAPATDEGCGLECDKLDRSAIRFHLEQYIAKLIERYGSDAASTFNTFEIDSWECGIQNWTEHLDARFQETTGYDLLTWVPLLTEGVIIDNYDASMRMLWDWRRFLADRIADEYYGEIARFSKERNLHSVVEASGRQMYLYDPITYQRHSGIPMGEFWNAVNPRYGGGVREDNRIAASIAHLTGKQLVASESYTTSPDLANWTMHPFTLKPLGDRAFCDGVNRFIFHTFAHQTWTRVTPGMTMGHWGMNFHRNNTWWEPGRAWIDYISRCQYLLQSGRFVADVLYYLGEDVPTRLAGRDELVPVLPSGYDFDGCDFQALLDARVENHRIVMPSGMEYRILLLPAADHMRPRVMQRILKLVQDGAVILGTPPVSSPSLSDAETGDTQIRDMAEQIWGSGPSAANQRAGNGQVFRDRTFEQVFDILELPPDFSYQANIPEAELLYIHRRIGETDAYFISNQHAAAVQALCRFRVEDKIPELWDPATGAVTPLAAYRQDGQLTAVPVSLDPHGSVFMIFRTASPGNAVEEVRLDYTPVLQTTRFSPTPPLQVTYDAGGQVTAEFRANGDYEIRLSGATITMTETDITAPLPVEGLWRVSFPPDRGAPESITLETLEPLNEHADFGVRHFSGTAIYQCNFTLPADRLGGGKRIQMDLGDVKFLAEIEINGKPSGILWKPPFHTDVTELVAAGENTLAVHVTNLWPNRMIGDAYFPEVAEWTPTSSGVLLAKSWPEWLLKGEKVPGGRVTFSSRSSYKKDDPLLESGLLGPVVLRTSVRRVIQ